MQCVVVVCTCDFENCRGFFAVLGAGFLRIGNWREVSAYITAAYSFKV